MAQQNNKPLLNRKEWQGMTPAPSASAAGSFFIAGTLGVNNIGFYCVNNATHYLYHHDEDAWLQIISGALAGTFGAGACGVMARWSNTVTANGGSTTSLTTAANINGLAMGKTIRFLTGANAGQERTIDRVFTNPGGNATLGWSVALGAAVANTDTFMVNTGLAVMLCAGTLAAGSFRSYDLLTGTWTTLSITGLPATWGTDGKLVNANSRVAFASGTATAGGASTLTNAAKTWTANQWTNYQIRITGGTGVGQLPRIIASNTGTVITTATPWTIAPDATSQYVIEGNDDYFYLMGNNAVTMYRYSRRANAWATMAPTVARGGAPVAGMSANWVDQTGDADWANESAILNGRYIYSFRGGSSTLDRFDIAGGTAGAGAWAAITYNNATETFGAGSGYAADTRYIYIRKDATFRYFKYSLRGNYLEPISTNLYGDGTAVIGDKLWVKNYDDAGVIKWLYAIRNSATELHRLPLY